MQRVEYLLHIYKGEYSTYHFLGFLWAGGSLTDDGSIWDRLRMRVLRFARMHAVGDKRVSVFKQPWIFSANT